MGSIATYARLSRPRGLNSEHIVSYLHSGLPLNSLPGWELIPLNSKLPMLKCPGNHVIFSKQKIGEHVKRPKQKFNPITFEKMPEYRSLEDDHLRDFFLRGEVLKRLRANGEITENNDIICTLKDFNQFRRELDRSKRNLELQISMEKALDAYDQRLVDNAEKIAEKTTHNDDFFGIKVRERRTHLEKKRQENFERNWQRIMDRLQQLEQRRQMEKAAWQEKRILHDLNLKHHNEVVLEMSRRKIIKNKIHAKLKLLRSRNVLINEEKRRKQERYDRLWESWQKRLTERINNGQYMHELVEKAKQERKLRIAEFTTRHHKLWAEFQSKLNKMSSRNRKRLYRICGMKHLSKSKTTNKEKENINQFDKFDSFNELLDDELYILLSNLVDSEECNIPFDDDDPLYKAANFIKTQVLRKFKTDLSENSDLLCAFKKRLAPYMVALKYNTVADGQRILVSLNTATNMLNLRNINSERRKRVCFNHEVENIFGQGYEVHPDVKLRSVAHRAPTPKSSLASILVEAECTLRWGMNLSLKRIRVIFLEYVFARFKRQVIVGVQNRVLRAIELEAKGKVVLLRKELLDISEFYLINKASKAILSFAVDKINFDACVLLCINVMSSKIICMLQKLMPAYCNNKEKHKEIVTDTWFMEQQYILPQNYGHIDCT